MPPSRTTVALLALSASALAGVAAAAPPASAATHSTHPSAHTKPVKQHPKPVKQHRKPVKAARFSAQGLIAAADAHSVTVLARTLHTGGTVSANRVITVRLASKPAHRGHPMARTVGDRITLAGTTSAGIFTASTAVEQNNPAHLLLGTVLTVNGDLLTVAKAAKASDDPSEDTDGQDSFTVDVSNAPVTLDGATGGALAPGQTIAVLGEGDDDTVLAASVFAYTTAPTELGGDISAVTGTSVTLSSDSDSESDSTTSTLELAGVPLYLNGNPGATPDQLTPDTHLITLGTTNPATGTYTPTLGFAFNTADTHPAGDNTDD